MGNTGIHSSSGMVIIGIGMCDRNGTQILCLLNKLCSTGQFGGDIHNANQTVTIIIELLEAVKIRLLQIVRILSAPLGIGEVGAFHLNTHNAGMALGSLSFSCFAVVNALDSTS